MSDEQQPPVQDPAHMRVHYQAAPQLVVGSPPQCGFNAVGTVRVGCEYNGNISLSLSRPRRAASHCSRSHRTTAPCHAAVAYNSPSLEQVMSLNSVLPRFASHWLYDSEASQSAISLSGWDKWYRHLISNVKLSNRNPQKTNPTALCRAV